MVPGCRGQTSQADNPMSLNQARIQRSKCCLRSRGTEEQVCRSWGSRLANNPGHAHPDSSCYPRYPTAGSVPFPTPPVPKVPEMQGLQGPSNRLRLAPPSPTGPGELVSEPWWTSSEGVGDLTQAPPSFSIPTPPLCCAPRLADFFLPGRSVKVGRGATSLSPGQGERGSAPPAPAGALSTDLRPTGPNPGLAQSPPPAHKATGRCRRSCRAS